MRRSRHHGLNFGHVSCTVDEASRPMDVAKNMGDFGGTLELVKTHKSCVHGVFVFFPGMIHSMVARFSFISFD